MKPWLYFPQTDLKHPQVFIEIPLIFNNHVVIHNVNVCNSASFQLINICSNDGQRLYEAVSVGPLLAGGPLVALLGLSYTAYFLGPTALLGSTVFVLFYPTMVRFRLKHL